MSEGEIDEIKFGGIHIWIPKGNIKAVNTAKKMLDIYLEYYESAKAQE